MQEIWKNIIGFENYQISNFGKIKSLSREINCEGANNHDTRTIKEKFLKYYTNKNGYYSVVLYKNKKPYTKLVHRLVAQAFIPNPNNLPQVNHIDCNKLNNNVTNLEWCTQSENTQHAYDNNLINLNTRKKKKK